MGKMGILGGVSQILQGKQTKAASYVPGFGGASFSTPAFSLSSNGANTTLTPTNTIFQQANQQNFPAFLKEIGQLKQSVAPGVSVFRKAALGQIEAGRNQTVGNLRESLARRGVFGSSFGQDVISRANAEFAQQRANVEAQSYAQEFNATTALINMQNDEIMKKLNYELDQLKLSTGIGVNVQQLINQNAAIKAQAVLGDQNVKLARDKLSNEILKEIAKGIAGGMTGGASGAMSGFGG